MGENIRLAFQGIWSHKLRSALTMLGIIIGIASIMSIVSTIQGTNDALREELIGSGNNTVKVNLSSGGEALEIDGSNLPAGVPVIAQQTLDEILALDSVEAVTCYTNRFSYEEGIRYGSRTLSSYRINGIDENYFSTLGYRLRTGRFFRDSDYASFAKVIILDQTASDNLFQGINPLGQTVEIDSNPFTVIGVVYAPSTFEPEINDLEDYSAYDTESNGVAFIPKASWPIIYQYDEPENVIVRATSTDTMTKAGQRTAKILNRTITARNSNVNYMAEDLLSTLKSQQKLRNATNLQLFWIAGISLLVGGIGVMNIMLVSVTERTSEIGLKKAIGARKSRILWQFLTEAAVLTSLGGILGVAAGIAMSQIIHRVTGILVGINWLAAIVAVLFSMAIGIIFGLIPSVQASNLDPIEALRRE